MKSKLVAMWLLLVLVAAAPVFAQVATGSLAGTVMDQSGAVIPAAKIIATNAASGAKIEAISSDAGLYVFAAVPPGVYSISAEKVGFKKTTRADIEIRIAQRVDMNIGMEVGNVQESITVSAEVPLLETSTSERGSNVSVKFMNDLPLFTGGIRSMRGFVAYMPGRTANSEESVNGSGGRGQEMIIDGASALNVESSTMLTVPAAEMFSEFKMNSSNFSAEYGRVAGGVEVYVPRSGTNWLHGAAFLNMRRDIWNANAWARNASTNPATNFRAKERFNEIGGAIGGPVWIPKLYDGKDKTFWYFTYSKDQRPVSVSFPVLTVPTALMKQGNFSQAGVPVIYDPATTSGNTRTPFAGNIIPTARITNIAKNVAANIPDPNVGTLASNFNFVNQSAFDRYTYSMKFDHAFSATNRLAYFFTNEVQAQDDLSNFPGLLGVGLQSFQKPYNHRFNHDWSIKPNLLMHTTYGFTITRQAWDNPNQKGGGSKLGFKVPSGDSDATPRIIFNGAAGLSPYGVQDGKVANGAQFNRQHWLSQGYTLIKGKHEVKFGWAWRRFETLGQDLAGTNGRYQFNRAETASPTALTSTGHEFASMLLGAVDLADNVVPPVLFDTTIYYDYSGYVQDNWRVTSKLTINLGMRYEVPIGWHVPNGNGYSHVDINVPNPGAGGRPGALVFSGVGPGRNGQKRFYPTAFGNIGPRLGFAYQVAPKTVIRGGYAIFYTGLSGGGCGCRYGFSGSNSLQSDGLNPVMNWENGIPLAPGYRPPPIIDPTYVNYQNVAYQGPTYGQPGRIKNWSLNIQHEIKNWLIDVAYQGNRGTRLNSTADLNQLPTSYLQYGALLGKRIDSPEAIAAGFKKPYDSFPGNLSVAQSLRPYPQYLAVQSLIAGFGHSWYDALQAKVERRFGTLQFMANYTWSKALDYGHYRNTFGQIGSPGATPQDYYNIPDSKSFTNFDIPHVFNVLLSYDMPFGKGKKYFHDVNAITNAFIGGWTIASADTYRKGTLIWLNTPGNPLGSGVLFTQITKANVGTGAIRTGIDRTSLDPNDPNTLWFNKAAFTAAPAYTLGNAAFYYNDFRQPAVFTENISLIKRTTLFQNDKNPIILTYRADAFNAFNRTNFGGVNGTIGNASFGRPSAPQNSARLITMGLRLEF